MKRAALLVAGLAIVLVGFAPTKGGASSETGLCADVGDFVDVPGQGPSCWTGEAWLLRFPDGHEVLTHGPDAAAVSLEGIMMPPPIAPPCVPASEPHQLLIYARNVDTPDAYETMVPEIRRMAGKMNALLIHESAEFGQRIEYPFLCDADGQPVVDHVVLNAPSAAGSFYAIVNELRLRGYTSDLAKYLVWYDRNIADPSILYGGEGEIASDSRLVADNLNNRGGTFALTYERYGDYGAAVMMHESGHNHGAVQTDTPNDSDRWHCIDGLDVMCYEDGSNLYSDQECDAFHFDCHHDDYFNPAPAEGSYLATHWNLASTLNRFVLHTNATPVPAPFTCDWDTRGGGASWVGVHPFLYSSIDIHVPLACQGQPFLLEALSSGSDFDVCWSTGPGTTIRCDANVGSEGGNIPATATQGKLIARDGAGATYRLRAGGAL